MPLPFGEEDVDSDTAAASHRGEHPPTSGCTWQRAWAAKANRGGRLEKKTRLWRICENCDIRE